jgi:hypothetical protein
MRDITDILQASHDQAFEHVKLIDGFLKKRARLPDRGSAKGPFWAENFFGLEKSALFNKLSNDDQQRILLDCSNNLLVESYFIEKTGIAYSLN